MPYRAVHVFVAVAGLLTVLALLAVGVNLPRAAQRGPAWKRRLIGAGLFLLAAVGLGGCRNDPPTATETSTGQTQSASGLAATSQWQQIVAVWTEAEPIAAQPRGSYPFDEAGKKRLLAAIDEATGNLEVLRAARHLSDGEAGLLAQDLAAIRDGVQEKLPTEMRNTMCYAATVLPLPARSSAATLQARLSLLEKMAAQEKIAPEVLEKILPTIEGEMRVLRDEKAMAKLKGEELRDAEALRTKMEALLPKLRATRGTDPQIRRDPNTLERSCYAPMPAPREELPKEEKEKLQSRREELLDRFVAEGRIATEVRDRAARAGDEES
jgi:hypothetical protein